LNGEECNLKKHIERKLKHVDLSENYHVLSGAKENNNKNGNLMV